MESVYELEKAHSGHKDIYEMNYAISLHFGALFLSSSLSCARFHCFTEFVARFRHIFFSSSINSLHCLLFASLYFINFEVVRWCGSLYADTMPPNSTGSHFESLLSCTFAGFFFVHLIWNWIRAF